MIKLELENQYEIRITANGTYIIEGLEAVYCNSRVAT